MIALEGIKQWVIGLPFPLPSHRLGKKVFGFFPAPGGMECVGVDCPTKYHSSGIAALVGVLDRPRRTCHGAGNLAGDEFGLTEIMGND